MQKFQNNIQDQFGNEISLPTITVRNVIGGALSTLFEDDGVTPLANPFTAQDISEFFFYADNGRYDIFVTGPVTDAALDVLLFDPIGTPATIPIDLLDNEQIRFGDSQDTLMFFDGSDFIIQAVAGNLIFDGEVFATGSIYLTEKAAAGPDTLTLGQFWVRNDAPNLPMFTDDVGNDFILNAAVLLGSTVDSTLRYNGTSFIETDRIRHSATGVLTIFDPTLAQSVTLETSLTEAKFEASQDLLIKTADSAISFNIGNNNALTLQNNIVRVNTDSGGFFEIRDDIGNNVQLTTTSSSLVYQFSANVKSIRYFDGISIFMEEKAAAEVDVAGSGQFWVRNDAPNKPMFTDDVGTDFDLTVGGGGPATFRGCKAHQVATNNWPLNNNPAFTGADVPAEAAVQFNAESFDTDTIHDNVINPTRFVVPAGVSKVIIRGGYTIQGDTSGGYRHARIRLNGGAGGVDVSQPGWIPHATNSAAGSGSDWGASFNTGIINVANPGTDYFEMYVLRQNSSGLTVGRSVWMEMEIVS